MNADTITALSSGPDETVPNWPACSEVSSAIEATQRLIIQLDTETRRVLHALLNRGQLE